MNLEATRRWAALLLSALSLSAHADEADVQAIQAVDQAFYQALNGRDLAAMKVLWAQQPFVTNIGPRSKSMNVGYDATVKYWEDAFNYFSQLSVAKVAARVESDGKTAWIVGTESATLQPRYGGEPLRFDTFVTHVFTKEDGRWLLVLHHAQMIPK